MSVDCAAPPHQDIAGVYAVLAEATTAVWDPDELMLSMQEEPPAQRRAMHDQRESKRKEGLEALIRDLGINLVKEGLIRDHPCSEADVMRLLQLHDEIASHPRLQLHDEMQRRPGFTQKSQSIVLATAEAAVPSSAPVSASLCATCLDRYMSASDLARLLLLGSPMPGLGLAAPIGLTRSPERSIQRTTHPKSPPLHRSGRTRGLSADAIVAARTKALTDDLIAAMEAEAAAEAAAEAEVAAEVEGAAEVAAEAEAEVAAEAAMEAAVKTAGAVAESANGDARSDGAERAYKAAVAASEEIFLVLDPEHVGSISVRQLLVAFHPPSAELRLAIERAGLELVE